MITPEFAAIDASSSPFGEKDMDSVQAWTNEEVQRRTSRRTSRITENSPFFKSNPPRSLPVFAPNEIEFGDVLGEGQFGIVREVKQIRRNDKELAKLLMTESVRGKNYFDAFDPPLVSKRGEDKDDNSKHGSRLALQVRCQRDGKARFAVKRVRDVFRGDDRFHGAVDIASEAKFLASLSHPNIVRLRATVGVQGHPDFMLILDRLYSTLGEQLMKWKKDCRRSRSLFNVKRSKDKSSDQDLVTERLYAAYDIARAIKHLHENNIIYRDLKPENVAYDIRGDVRIFDLGLAREVTEKDLIRLPEDYQCTGLTGSRRWMAPEVVLSRPYGPSVDVYSFALLFWNIFSLQTPFGNSMTLEKHYQKVVLNGKRPDPKQALFLPDRLRDMMKLCWDEERSIRPSMQEICLVIKFEIERLERVNHGDGSSKTQHSWENILHRTQFLNLKSDMSFREEVSSDVHFKDLSSSDLTPPLDVDNK